MAWPPGEGVLRGATSQGKEERCDGKSLVKGFLRYTFITLMIDEFLIGYSDE